jgi:hypothetical protein
MRRRLALFVCTCLLAAAGAAATGPATQAAGSGQQAAAAKTCSSGFTHAVINHQQKCLRRGEFCAHRYRKQYRRYGYDCVKRDRNGAYHLT